MVETVSSRGGFGGWGGGSRRQKAGSATCNAEGRFAVSGLGEGRFTVRASSAVADADDEQADAAAPWHARLEDVAAGTPKTSC